MKIVYIFIEQVTHNNILFLLLTNPEKVNLFR